ncbi:hypothetical protein [Paraliomyxa miuraensis]|uniref:hypothetical protein n=1 Tax=Paraliomyxa miuraensis TaxID=376150 RepID=UPI002256DF32|nr:hypothetical protein [Paraliomyxa miuraensis]MCX4242702.1 hypothetical protein [Paraliomyxa miuraensis]
MKKPLVLQFLVPLTLASFAFMPTARAASNDVCVRQAQGVPFASKPTPEWWNRSLSEAKREVRWTGATVRTGSPQSSAPQLSTTRMIWDKGSKTVFFEFEVNGDPSFDPDEDFVMLAFSDEQGTSPGLFALFHPLKSYSEPGSTQAGIDGPVKTDVAHSVEYWEAPTFDSASTISGTDFQVLNPWVKVDRISSNDVTTYKWKFSLALSVPVDQEQIRPNLRVYANVNMSLGSGAPAVQFPLLCNPSTGKTCMMSESGSTIIETVPYQNMANTWPVLVSSNPDGCGGVKLSRELVGSDYQMSQSPLGNDPSYSFPSATIPTSGARLRAGFHNDTDQTIASGSIEAEFRIADWGAQWQDWEKTATWTRILADQTITLQGDVGAGRYAGESRQGLIQSGLFVPPTYQNSHQCMHVRLKARTGGIHLAVDSVYRNMDIVSASVARRPGVIDLTDRPLPKGKTKHEVYLLVRTEHMPDPATCNAAKGKLYGCAKGGRILRERRALTKAQKRALKADFAARRTNLDQEQVDALLEQKDRKGVKTEELPFVVVYAMVDTGRRIDLPGKPKTPVLEQFSEFGYYVEHEGDLEGWESLLHGAEPVPGTNNLFKLEIEPKTVASVANTVRVLSKETKACKARPHARLGVVSRARAEEVEARILTDVGKGDPGTLSKTRVTDDQLGCEPPPLREPCRLKHCTPHSPAAFIEGSRYVGDWKPVERKLGTLKGKRAE